MEHKGYLWAQLFPWESGGRGVLDAPWASRLPSCVCFGVKNLLTECYQGEVEKICSDADVLTLSPGSRPGSVSLWGRRGAGPAVCQDVVSLRQGPAGLDGKENQPGWVETWVCTWVWVFLCLSACVYVVVGVFVSVSVCLLVSLSHIHTCISHIDINTWFN